MSPQTTPDARAQDVIDRINGILFEKIDAPPAKAKGKNGRGNGGRREYDFYPTPRWQTDHLLDRVDLAPYPGASRPTSVLEPCVGEGHIVNAIKARYHDRALVRTNDIDYRHDAGSHADARLPSLWNPEITKPIDWVVTNPPFSDAFEILRLAFESARVGVAFLLRVTWLEPTKTGARAAWLAEHPPTEQYILERTSYDGAGQDSATSAWFVWRKDWRHGDPQRIEIIPGRARKEALL